MSSDLYKAIWGQFELLEEYLSPFISLDEIYPQFYSFWRFGIDDERKQEDFQFYARITSVFHDVDSFIDGKALEFHDEKLKASEYEAEKLIFQLTNIINKYRPQLIDCNNQDITRFISRHARIIKVVPQEKVLPIFWNIVIAEFGSAIALNTRKYFRNIIKSLQESSELNPDLKEKDLTSVIIKSVKRIQGLKQAIHQHEKNRTAVLANFIDNFFVAKDESSWGISSTGKAIGEPDIKIENGSGEVISICEGINLASVVSDKTTEHLLKIFTYDVHGVDYNYFIIFSESRSFSKFWSKYISFLQNQVNFKYELVGFEDVSGSNVSKTSDIRVGLSTHLREGYKTRLYHICVNMK